MPRSIELAAAVVAAALSLGAPLAASAADAMRVVKDAATGELRAPNAAEALAFEKAEAQLRAAQRASGKATAPARVTGIETRYADGTVETSLGDDTHMVSVVTTGADGKLHMDCLPAQQAQAMVKSAKKPSTARTGATSTKAAHVHQ